MNENRRIKDFIQRITHLDLASFLIENPVDLFYLTGLTLSKGRLVVTQKEARLLVDGRYFEYAKEKAPCPVFLWNKETAGAIEGPIGFDSGWTTVAYLAGLQKQHPDQKFVPLLRPLQQQRLIKDPEELKSLRKAAEVTWEGVKHLKNLLKEGISEQELAFEFEVFVHKKGARGLSFEPIIAFGEHSAHPHHRASEARLKKNQVVLIDVGAVFENYRGDVTRVIFFGTPNPELQKLYDLTREAAKAAEECVYPGTLLGDLDRAARAKFAKEGLEQLFSHNLGHGVGIECHEFPSIRWDGEDKDLVLAQNMVFTIEPGLYQPGLGGVRYENTGVVTESGFASFYPEL